MNDNISLQNREERCNVTLQAWELNDSLEKLSCWPESPVTRQSIMTTMLYSLSIYYWTKRVFYLRSIENVQILPKSSSWSPLFDSPYK